MADSPTIRTTFVLFNPTGDTVTVTITITGDDGGPLALDLANLGTQSQFIIVLPPGGTRILRTNGTGDGLPGAAQVMATSRIGVSAIFSLFDGQGNFLTETGIGDARVSAHFKIPVDTTGDFNTGVALFNTTAQAADLQFMLFDTDGNQVASTELQLPGGGHLAKFVAGPGELFPQVTETRGTLGIWSSQRIAALTIRQNVARLNLTCLPAVPEDSTDKEFILPHIGDGPQSGVALKTTFLLFNLSSVKANVQIDLTADDGSPLSVTIDGTTASSFNVMLEPKAASFLATAGDGGAAGTLRTGAAEVASDQPIGVSGIFTLVDDQGNFLTETGIGTSEVLTAATVAVDTIGDTGLAFYNPGDTAEELMLRFFDSEGNPGQAPAVAGATPAQNGDPSVVTLTLQPGEHDAQFAGEIFKGVNLGLGSVAIMGRAAILTVRQVTDPRLSFTAFPVGRGAYSGVVNPESGPALPKFIENMTVTSDQTVDVQLPAGLTLSGEIQTVGDEEGGAPGATPTLVRATHTDGRAFFTIPDILTGSYSRALPAGTYNLAVCYVPLRFAGMQATVFTQVFEDPKPVVLSQDTVRDITLTPLLMPFRVSGKVSAVDQLDSDGRPVVITLTNEGTTAAFAPLTENEVGNEEYRFLLPDGKYKAGIIALGESGTPDATAVGNIRGLTIDGADLMDVDFTVPSLARLSGEVRNFDLSPLGPTEVLAFDTTIFDFRPRPVRSPPGSAGEAARV